MIDKSSEQFRFYQDRKDESENRSQEVGIVGDIVRLPLTHIPGIDQVACGKEDSRDREKSEKIEFFPGIEKDKGEEDRGNCA